MKTLIITFCILILSMELLLAQDTITFNKPKEKDAQKVSSIIVQLKEGSPITVYIDSMKGSSEGIDLLNFDKINSISVIKGEEVLKKYNTPTVIFITSKKEENLKIGKSEQGSITISRINTGNNSHKAGDPVIVIDEKVVKGQSLKEISPDDIDQIRIRKDQKTMDKYNTKVGVIFVTTKKNSDFKIKLDGKNSSNIPVIVIDDRISDLQTLKELPENEIYSMKVLQDEKSMKKYNSENGVIIVTTKKEKIH